MIAWAMELVVSASLLMLLVLAVRKPVASLFGAEWAYALWLLPVLVPLLPPLPSLTPAPVFTLLLPPVGGGGAPAEVPTGSGGWLLLLLALWGGGAAVFAIWQQSTYSAFMLHLGPQGRTAVPPSYGGIKVVESDAVEGPVALGIFNRRIVVPVDFGTRYSAAEQRLALEHELIHHRRLDLVWNWAALGMLTLNWFNPIAHIAFRAFRADQELACDAAVTRKAPAERHEYACALIKSASVPGLVAVCPLNNADMLKRRLRMMKKHRVSWGRTGGGIAAIMLVGAVGSALATPSFAQQGEKASAPLIVNDRHHEPIIGPRDVKRLREKCGSDGRGDASIICTDEEAKDPEVRAIMDRTMQRVKVRVDEVKLSKRTIRKIRTSVERAKVPVRATEDDRNPEVAHRELDETRPQVFMIRRGEHMAHVGKALGRAGVGFAPFFLNRLRTEMISVRIMAARNNVDQARLLAQLRPQVREVIAQAQKDVDAVEIDIKGGAGEPREELSREPGPVSEKN